MDITGPYGQDVLFVAAMFKIGCIFVLIAMAVDLYQHFKQKRG